MIHRTASATTAALALGAFALALTFFGAVRAQMAGGYDPMAPRGSANRPAETEVPLNPEFGNLPDTPGVEDVYYNCSGCHSLVLVKQQRLTDARWEYTLNWMIEVQKMPEPDEETKRRILDYLKRHFSSEG